MHLHVVIYLVQRSKGSVSFEASETVVEEALAHSWEANSDWIVF